MRRLPKKTINKLLRKFRYGTKVVVKLPYGNFLGEVRKCDHVPEENYTSYKILAPHGVLFGAFSHVDINDRTIFLRSEMNEEYE